jgi:hypothetical protein
MQGDPAAGVVAIGPCRFAGAPDQRPHDTNRGRHRYSLASQPPRFTKRDTWGNGFEAKVSGQLARAMLFINVICPVAA